MSPELVGALAESVGAAAVVISLLYVARQVRQGGQQARLLTVHEVTGQFQSIMRLTAGSVESARIWGQGLLEGISSLESDEAFLFGQLVGLLTSSYADLFHYHREGLIDDARLREIERPSVAVMACPGFSDYWGMYGHLHGEEFRSHVERVVREARSSVDLSTFERLASVSPPSPEPAKPDTA